MVKTLQVYKAQCEHPGCGRVFSSTEVSNPELEAKKCEDLGVFGPEVKKGVILESYINDYLITVSNHSDKGHQMVYGCIKVKGRLYSIREKEKRLKRNPDSILDHVEFESTSHDVSSLDGLMGNHTIRKLRMEDFRAVSQLIRYGQSTAKLREALQELEIHKFFRTDPFFEKLKII